MATPSANHEWIPQGLEDLSRRASTEVGAGAMSPVDKVTLKAVKQRKKEQRHYLAEKRRAARAARGHDYTVGEEIANAITHGIGAGLAIAAIPIAVVTALNHGGGVSLLCALVYTIGMLCEYLISTLYHAIQPLGAKRVFRVLDHSCIYLYIAATYMPYCLITLADVGGLWLCLFVWAVSLIGIVFEAFWVTRPRWISAVLYVALGWSVVVFLPQLYSFLAPAGFWLLVAGGISYTVGAVLYAATKKVRYIHSVFHVFVLGGSVCQFLSIVLYVL